MKTNATGWRIAQWALMTVFLLTAVLNMAHVRGGFWTNHAADLSTPALLYVLTRGLSDPARNTRLTRLFGQSPHTAAAWVFGGSAVTEISQAFWPHGVFRGTFDPLDLVAYAVGVGVCWAVDLWARARVPESRPTGTVGER